MSELPYLDDLRHALTLLGEIENELDKAKARKEIIREKVRQWLDITNLDEFEIMDSNDSKLWRMSVKNISRRSANYDYLEQILTSEQKENAIKTTESETFKCQPVKSSKKNTAKRAPKGNIINKL